MLQGVSVPLLLKIGAAVAITGGAGVVTYEVIDPGTPSTVVVDGADAGEPAALAFEEREETEEVAEPAAPAPAEKTAVDHDSEDVEAPEGDTLVEDIPVEKPEQQDHAEAAAVNADTTPPELHILWPEDGSHHDRARVVFEGETEPGARVFAGPWEAEVSDDGHWRIELILGPGANRATLAAEDAAGNIADAAITVWLDPVEVEPPAEKETKPGDEHPDEPLTVEFTANQHYGSCGEEVPFDVFWGTAAPNTLVEISSPYGNAVAEVGPKGHWEKKVWFEHAPRGVWFDVWIHAENGSTSFDFVAEHPEGDKAEA